MTSSKLSARSNSTRFVSPSNVRSSIMLIRHLDRYIRCKLIKSNLRNLFRWSVLKLFPENSSTWVVASRPSGMTSRSLLTHSVVCFPFFHLQMQGNGQHSQYAINTIRIISCILHATIPATRSCYSVSQVEYHWHFDLAVSSPAYPHRQSVTRKTRFSFNAFNILKTIFSDYYKITFSIYYFWRG